MSDEVPPESQVLNVIQALKSWEPFFFEEGFVGLVVHWSHPTPTYWFPTIQVRVRSGVAVPPLPGLAVEVTVISSNG